MNMLDIEKGMSATELGHSETAHSDHNLLPHAGLLSDPALVKSDECVQEAREHIRRAGALLRSLGGDYARVGWLLEDAVEMLHEEEIEDDVDYSAEFEVLTREFIPTVRAGLSGNGEIVARPKKAGSKGRKTRTRRD